MYLYCFRVVLEVPDRNVGAGRQIQLASTYNVSVPQLIFTFRFPQYVPHERTVGRFGHLTAINVEKENGHGRQAANIILAKISCKDGKSYGYMINRDAT